MLKYCVLGDVCFHMIRNNEELENNLEEEKIRKENDIISFGQMK